MIITLRGADFSAKNIGTIEVPVVIDDDIFALLQNYSKNLGTNQKGAVQTFIKTLRDSGVMSKLTCLYLPLLAGTVGEAFVNCVDDASRTPDENPDSSYYGIDNLGLIRTAASGGTLTMTKMNGLNENDYSLFLLMSENNVANPMAMPYWDTANHFIFSKGQLNYDASLNLGNSYVGTYKQLSSLVTDTTSPLFYDEKTVGSPLFYGVSFSGAQFFIYKGSATYTDNVKTYSLSSEINHGITDFYIDKSYPRLLAPHSVIAGGHALTTAQAKALCDAGIALQSTFATS